MPEPGLFAAYLKDDDDVDILAHFCRLPTTAKLSAIEDVAVLYSEARATLLRYRCLVVLANFLVAFGDDRAKSRLPAHLQALIRDVIDGSAGSVNELATHLKAKAATTLKMLIESKLTKPELTISSTHVTESFVRIDSPVRLDLGMGGISDIPPYCFERAATCVNVPVLLNRIHPISATAQLISEPYVQLVSKDLGVESVIRDWSELDDLPGQLRFHRAVLSYFRTRVPGFDTWQRVSSRLHSGIRIVTQSRLPPGTGLGVSSLLCSAALSAVARLFGAQPSAEDLVSASVYLEWLTGIGGGWEDATALLSGVKLLETVPERPFAPIVTSIPLNKARLNRLQRHLILINTGIVRTNETFLVELMERYCLREPTTLRCILRIADLNLRLPDFLDAGDLEAIGRTMAEQWQNWRECSAEKCTNGDINDLFSRLEPYVYGARMNGIGQGGCAMFMLRRRDDIHHVQRIIRSILGPSTFCYNWRPVLTGSPQDVALTLRRQE